MRSTMINLLLVMTCWSGTSAIARSQVSAKDIEIVQVQGTDAPKKIELYGKIHSAKHSDIHFPIAGTVDKMLVINGQTVNLGEPLVSLAKQDKLALIEQTQQQIKTAQKELEKLQTMQKKLDIQQLKDKHALYLAKKNHDKLVVLRKQQVVSTLQLEDAAFRMDEKKALLLQSEYKAALNEDQVALESAHIEVLKSTMEMTKAWLDKSELKAPFAGKIRNIYVKPGQVITRNDPLIELVDSKNMMIRAVLSHSEVTELKQMLKQSGLSTVKIAVGEQVFSARVLSILPDSKDNLTGVDMMVLTQQGNDDLIGKETAFTMLIPTEKKRYEVPAKAIVNQRFVFKLSADNTVVQVPIEVVQFPTTKAQNVLVETDQLAPVDTLLIAKHKKIQTGEQIELS